MQLIINDIAGIKTIAISGRLDTTTYSELETELGNLFNAGTYRMILDCTNMDYVSSSGLRVFLTILKKIKSVGGKLALCGLQPAIHNVFEISGFLSIFMITPSQKEAMEQM